MIDLGLDLVVVDRERRQIAREAVGFRIDDGVARIFHLVLELERVVLERGVAKLEGGLAAERLELVAAIHREAFLIDVDIVAVDDVDIVQRFNAVAVFDRVFVLEALGLHVKAVEGEFAILANRRFPGEVRRVIRAVARIALELAVVQVFANIVIAQRRLALRVVTALHARAEQQAAVADLAAPHGASRFTHATIIERQGAETDIAAFKSIAVFQNDVDRARHRVARTVGRGRAHDLDLGDQFGRNAIHEEGGISAVADRARRRAGARHFFAIDQDLRVGRIKAAQAHAIRFQHVRQEGDRRHALQRVANRQRLKALEIVGVVNKNRRRVGGTVAVGDAVDDNHIARVGYGAVRIAARGDGLRIIRRAGLRECRLERNQRQRGAGDTRQVRAFQKLRHPYPPSFDGRALVMSHDSEHTVLLWFYDNPPAALLGRTVMQPLHFLAA